MNRREFCLGMGLGILLTLNAGLLIASSGSSGGGSPVVLGVSTLTQNGLLLGQGASAITATDALTNGQVLIGSTGAAPVRATLSAGSDIGITNASGAITIAFTAGEIKTFLINEVFLDATNPPAQALSGNNPVLDFDPSTDQIIYATIPIPPDMDVTATVAIRATITMSTSSAANVVIAGDYLAIANGDSITGTATTYTVTTTPDATAGELSLVTAATVAANTFSSNGLIALEFRRDADNGSDNHGGNLRLVTLELRYTTRVGAS